jgi:hypothetical protein
LGCKGKNVKWLAKEKTKKGKRVCNSKRVEKTNSIHITWPRLMFLNKRQWWEKIDLEEPKNQPPFSHSSATIGSNIHSQK